MQDHSVRESRGLSIWPFLLIGVGVVWLLREAGILSGANIAVLARLWPVILIAIGVELLVARNNRALSTVIGLATIVILLALMLVGPSMGLASNRDVKQEQIIQPLNDATSARVSLSAGAGDLNIEPLSDSTNLIEADIRYIGHLDQTNGGEDERRIVEVRNDVDGAFTFVDFFGLLDDGNQPRWDVALNNRVPLDLSVNSALGSTNLNLGNFSLENLSVTSGTGSIEATLPNVEGEQYSALVSSGTGSITLRLEEDSALELQVQSGTGSTTIDVPDNGAVRLIASVGTGGISVPSWLGRTSGEDENFVGDSGEWESAGFSSAERQIIITFNGGTSSLAVR